MSKFGKLAAAAAVSGALTLGSVSSEAVPFEFFKIGGDGGDVGHQFTVNVTDNNDGRVSFLFNNLGPVTSSITNIYFDNGPLLAISPPLESHEDVSFELGSEPSRLPGGASLDPRFVTDIEFNTSVEQNTADGIEPGQWLEILFSLKVGQTFNTTIAALLSGALRIGLQVRAIGASGESAQFVNSPTPIPLPTGLVLFLSGLAGIGFLGRYKARRRELAAS